MFALGLFLAFLTFKKIDHTDEIARPPTPALLAPPAFTSRQIANKVSLTSLHSAPPESSDPRSLWEDDAVRRVNLSPQSASLDGATVRSRIEMPGR